MSLLDGRTEVVVRPVRMVVDEWGTSSRVEGDPVRVPCSVKWQRASEVPGVVTGPATGVDVIAREWPGDANCRFSWDGYEFEQVGPTLKFYGSDLTRHCEVYARLISHETTVEEVTDVDSDGTRDEQGGGG